MGVLDIGTFDRKNLLNSTKGQHFDVVVLGGGITGVCVARESAKRGLQVLLLEAKDFAYGTSSRSSKLVHGGLRYLAQGNLGLVREALQERARLMSLAPHLVRAQKFLFPISKNDEYSSLEIRIGLSLYDFLSKFLAPSQFAEYQNQFSRHAQLKKSSEEWQYLSSIGLEFENLYSYFDGQMDDARLVLEIALDAIWRGGICINHSKVQSVENISQKSSVSKWKISWEDQITKESHSVNAKYLVNALGPWLPNFHQENLAWPTSYPNPVYSRGAHLLFNFPWKGPGVFLPTGEKGRNYWVLPHFAVDSNVTLVGTTDKKVENNAESLEANEEEINELLGFLKRDFKNLPFCRDDLFSSFCGMRIIASKISNKSKSSELSRSEHLIFEEDYTGIFGGKYTTAYSVALKVLKQIEKSFDLDKKKEVENDKLLCAFSQEEEQRLAIKELEQHIFSIGLAELGEIKLRQIANRLVNRFGRKAILFKNFLTKNDTGVDSLALDFEYEIAIKIEQAQTLDDLIRRRFSFSFNPNLSESEKTRAETMLKKHL